MRERSGFERVDDNRKASSKCSKCHALGHTMTSKACPLRFADLLTEAAVLEPPLHRTAISAQSTENHSVIGHRQLIVEGPAEIDQRSTHTPTRQSSRLSVSPVPGSSYIALASVGQASLRVNSEEAQPQDVPAPIKPPSQPVPRYDSPVAIHARYVAARTAWYASQPAGSTTTNQQYRKA